MGLMTNRVKFQIYFFGQNIEINSFAFDIKVILGLESTLLGGGWVGGWGARWLGFAKLKPTQPQLKLKLKLG